MQLMNTENVKIIQHQIILFWLWSVEKWVRAIKNVIIICCNAAVQQTYLEHLLMIRQFLRRKRYMNIDYVQHWNFTIQVLCNVKMRWKKVMKDHLIAKTRSTSDLPTSNNGKNRTKCLSLIFNRYWLCNYLYLTISLSFHCALYIFAGDLSERIGARLHDLSQLQLENGKRSHLSRANISKSSRSVKKQIESHNYMVHINYVRLTPICNLLIQYLQQCNRKPKLSLRSWTKSKTTWKRFQN